MPHQSLLLRNYYEQRINYAWPKRNSKPKNKTLEYM